MTKQTVYFISGANRGIGFNLVKNLSERENTLILATARNPDSATELKKLPNVKVLKLDVDSKESIFQVAKDVAKLTDKIDVLISNAGIAKEFKTVLNTDEESYLRHYRTNFLGPVFLVQSLYPFLKKGDLKRIFFISTLVASIGSLVFSASAYGHSKTSLNYISKELSIELGSEGFIVVALHPGAVSTDMGNESFAIMKDKQPEIIEYLSSIVITPEFSAESLLKVFDNSTSKDNGKFLSYDGTELLW